MTGRLPIDAWPAPDDVDGWAYLTNLGLQLESLQIDIDESNRWTEAMKALIARQLPYDRYTKARLEALKVRLRRRKLDQANLRYKYGYREGTKPRRASLVREDVRRLLASHVVEPQSTTWVQSPISPNTAVGFSLSNVETCAPPSSQRLT